MRYNIKLVQGRYSYIKEGREYMNRFIPREKLSKKARKQLDSTRRVTWSFSPVTRRANDKKKYGRRKSHDRYDATWDFSFWNWQTVTAVGYFK